jgi:hypothetical protein
MTTVSLPLLAAVKATLPPAPLPFWAFNRALTDVSATAGPENAKNRSDADARIKHLRIVAIVVPILPATHAVRSAP